MGKNKNELFINNLFVEQIKKVKHITRRIVYGIVKKMKRQRFFFIERRHPQKIIGTSGGCS